MLPCWKQFSGLYKFQPKRQVVEEKEETEDEVLNSLFITFRALMFDMDLDTWLGWCEVTVHLKCHRHDNCSQSCGSGSASFSLILMVE